jgi:site-specific DNA recombinase
MKAALYIRVSTLHQIDKDSLPLQRKDLKNYSQHVLGIDDFEIFQDAGYSGKNTERPAYKDMMSRIREGEFTHLLVWKIDRISRNLSDFSEMWNELQSREVTFVSKNEQFDTSTAFGKAMLKILMVFAELEREMTVERVTAIMFSRADQGLWNGANVPIGYKWSEELKYPVPSEKEAPIVQRIYNLYESTRSCSSVAFHLNTEKISTKRGGTWTSKTVRDILRNPFHVGIYRYNYKDQNGRIKDKGEWIIKENNHEGIITKEQFDRVNKIMDENYAGDSSRQRSVTGTHIFAKKLVCANCHKTLIAHFDRPRRDGFAPSTYRCNNKEAGGANCDIFITEIRLLPFVLGYLMNIINLQKSPSETTLTESDIEKILLNGDQFKNIAGIDSAGLTETLLHLRRSIPNVEYSIAEPAATVTDEAIEMERLNKEKGKFEKALTRLESLYLYSEESMSEKDFIFKKRDIKKNLDDILMKLSDIHASVPEEYADEFLSKAQAYLLTTNLVDCNIDKASSIISAIGKDVLVDLIDSVIDKIEISGKIVLSITFRNGLTHRFAYREVPAVITNRIHTYNRLLPVVMDYIKSHGSINGQQLSEISGLTVPRSNSVLQEALNKNILSTESIHGSIQYIIKRKAAE